MQNKKKLEQLVENKVEPADTTNPDLAKRNLPIVKDTIYVDKIDTVFVTEKSGLSDEEIQKKTEKKKQLNESQLKRILSKD